MSIQNISSGTSAADFRVAGGKFYMPGASEFSGGLNLGEIIKGKVLRQYEGNRYLVSFDGGHERVVDSGVPLTTGELIHGRVIALGDRVELQRVYPDEPGVPTPAAAERVVPRHEQLIEDFAVRYRGALNPADKAALAQAARLASDPQTMALAGMALNKLGLQQSPELLWPVYRALQREDAPSAALYADANVLHVEAVAAGQAGAPLVAVRELADQLVRQMQDGERQDAKDAPVKARNAAGDPQPSAAAVNAVALRPDQDQGQGLDPRQLARWLLNAQGGGTVAHRIGTVPFLLGNQLIEVDLSFFEQHKEASRTPQSQHRKLMFSLHTEHLGTVEIAANVVGARVRLQVTTDRQDATTEASAHAQELRALLAAAGWEVDEIVYQTSQSNSQNGVVLSVVEHIISQDSLNRLA
jgi:hypothetical protein